MTSPSAAVKILDEQTIRRVFIEYCSSNRHGVIDAFSFQCAILAITGTELGTSTVREKIRHFSTLQELQGSVFTCIDVGGADDKSYSIFLAIVTSMLPDGQTLIKNMFKEVDLKCRGYISQEEFKTVLSRYAPHMSNHRGNQIFKSMDNLGLGKVTLLQFLSASENLHNLG
jgi:Ca2+-binding EF-hand superfamily protein